jgi:hypothetical protein
MKKDTARIELQIGRAKKEMTACSFDSIQKIRTTPEKDWSLRVSRARLSLRGCREIAAYIAKTSPRSQEN